MAAPAAPSNLVAVALTESRVDLQWDHDGVDTDGYSVERSTNGVSGWTEITTTTAKTYSDTDLPASADFYYRVRAYQDD